MHPFTVNYRKRDGHKPGTLVNRGFWLHGAPRPLLLCRLLKHKPVIDGTKGWRNEAGSRWVCCHRCGLRPEPQGHLEPAVWNIGDAYTGPWLTEAPAPLSCDEIRSLALAGLAPERTVLPGPWPTGNTGTFGGQIILGKSYSTGWGFDFKVGTGGSEHTLALTLRLAPICWLYLHTEHFGTWLQRRLNRTGTASRVTGLRLERGSLEWQLWSNRDTWSQDDPRWQRGSIKLDPRDRLFGRSRFDYGDVGDPVTATVRLPHGDDYDVTLKLQHVTDGRNRRRFHSWDVDWSCRSGIPTKTGGRGTIHGAAVTVSTEAVNGGSWIPEACASIATRITADRTRSGWRETADID
jgi:hypothetical protein